MHDALAAAIGRLRSPAVVGISGFGGAGKSTLAASLGLPVVPGDGFLIRSLCHDVNDSWAGVDRSRLSHQVLEPFRAGAPVAYDCYDWETDALVPQVVPVCDVLVVEGVGLIHPSLTWDLAVWLDVPADVALARGIARDAAQGQDLSEWPVWAETDRLYHERYRPDLAADLVLSEV
jgi:uridine kinase